MQTDLTHVCVTIDATIHTAMAQIDRSRIGIVLVVDHERRLVGTVTDGDIRRALLANVDVAQPVTVLLARKAGTRYAKPVTASIAEDPNTWLRVLQEHNILQLPLVDEARRVAGVVSLFEFISHGELPLQALIMAGGVGNRLRPLTEEVPKPMLPVGDRPLLEIMIEQLRDTGIKRMCISTHHHPKKISEHFGDGQTFGVELTYLTEERPLGTAGALGLIEPPQETLLVINGDIFTQVDFRAMLLYHREHDADLTVAVRQYDIKVPYGVIECEGSTVRTLSEKPVMSFLVNAGMYLLEPTVWKFVPHQERFDMTDLIQQLLKERRSVVSFPVREYWMDIGQRSDYERAQEFAKSQQSPG